MRRHDHVLRTFIHLYSILELAVVEMVLPLDALLHEASSKRPPGLGVSTEITTQAVC